MQIYMKDGKALWMNEKAITPKKAAVGETWVLNDELSFDTYEIDVSGVNFISNGINYSSIYAGDSDVVRIVRYDNTKVASSPMIGSITPSWTDQAYRTITFLEPPTGDLLTWLQANGTKQ